MTSSSAVHYFVRVLLAGGVGLLLAAGAASATDIKQAGPMVSVTGDGGDVQVSGASVTVAGTASKVQAAGAQVSVTANTTGNTEVAGAQVAVSGTVGGALHAAGADVDATGSVSGNADIGGAVVRLNLVTNGNVRVGGASVAIAATNDVRGSLKAYGAIVSISGHVGGPVEAGGAVVTFDGQADGPVQISGSRVVIGPNARISGDLTVRSLNPLDRQPGAVISGAVNQMQPQTWWSLAPWQFTAIFGAAVAAGTVLGGIVLLLFGGQVFITATEHVRHRPLSSFLFGILTLVIVPFVAVVLMATVIGISIGFAVLFLVPFLVIFGHAVAAAGIASGLLVRRPGAIGAPTAIVMLIVGAIVLVLISLIPWVGPLLIMVALFLGVGAFTRTLGGRIRRVEPAVITLPR